jgi:hypothetical protein
MNQTPPQSNLSRRRLPVADEGTQPDVEGTQTDVETIIRGLYKTGGGQRVFDKLNAGVLSVRQAFIVGDDKAAEKENVLLHLIRESGKALPLLLLKKKTELCGQQNMRSTKDNQLLEVLKWVCAPTKVSCPKNGSYKPKNLYLQDMIISLVDAVMAVLASHAPPEERLAAQKQFACYLLRAVLRDDGALPDYLSVIKKIEGIEGETGTDDSDDDRDDQTNFEVRTAKSDCKKILMRKLFGDELGAGFDYLVDSFDYQGAFAEQLKKVELTIKGVAMKMLLPNKKFLEATWKRPKGAHTDILDEEARVTSTESLGGGARVREREPPYRQCMSKFFSEILVEAAQGGDLQSFLDSVNGAIGPTIGQKLRLVALDPQSDLQSETSSPSMVPFLVPDDGTTTVDGANVFTLENVLKNPVVWQLLQLLTKEELDDAWKVLSNAMDSECSGVAPSDTASFEPDSDGAGAGMLWTEDDFHIVRFLGKGSFAAVFEALIKRPSEQAPEKEGRVALKLQTMNKKSFAKLFMRQLLVQSSLGSDFVVPIFGWFVVGQSELVEKLPKLPNKITVAIVMELGDCTLEDVRVSQLKDKKRKKLGVWYKQMLKTKLAISKALLEGLNHCHGLDMLHRDVKTESKCILVCIL